MTVIFAHAWNLKGQADPLSRLSPHSFGPGGMALYGFFVISGFLITASWMYRRHLLPYLRARVLRIWPAFAVALVISAALGAWGAGSLDAGLAYLQSTIKPIGPALKGFLMMDPQFLNTTLAFPNNLHPGVTNGSLWTIRHEFACYAAIALLGLSRILYRRKLMLVIAALCFAAYLFPMFSGTAPARPFVIFAAHFLAGCLFFLFSDRIPKSGRLALVCLATLIACLFIPRSMPVAFPICGTYLIFFTAFSAPAWMKQVGKTNDISYGVYLYAFPLQQLAYAYAPSMEPMKNFILCTLAACAAGWASWKLIEQPMLRLK